VNVYLVGNKSFIQNYFYSLYKSKINLIKITFNKFITNNKVSDGDVVINFSLDKNFFTENYILNKDRDLKIIKLLKNKKILFVILSTRMVYKQRLNLKETSLKKPSNIYGKNKLMIENNCSKIKNIKPKILILRLSNIIGYEINRIRSSLMSKIIHGINKNSIQLDNSYNKKKDLMPVELFCRVLFNLIKKRVYGTFNVGSGISISLLELSKIMLNSNKFFNIEIKIDKKLNTSDNDYSYNISKLKNIYKFNFKKKDLVNSLNGIRKKIYANK
jgi:dTDP-4-dehydrorhamnose reductase